jgi:hypothetical protein
VCLQIKVIYWIIYHIYNLRSPIDICMFAASMFLWLLRMHFDKFYGYDWIKRYNDSNIFFSENRIILLFCINYPYYYVMLTCHFGYNFISFCLRKSYLIFGSHEFMTFHIGEFSLQILFWCVHENCDLKECEQCGSGSIIPIENMSYIERMQVWHK